MKKILKIIILLMCCMALAGCGENKAESMQKEVGESNSIDGFVNATLEYGKFNSYASENGLGGTLIYIEGKVLNQTVLNDSEIPVLLVVVEQKDGNRWAVSVTSDSEIKEIDKKDVRIFGTYQGFSDVANLPALTVAVNDNSKMDKAIIEVEQDEKYITAWSFSNYVKEQIEKGTESKTESPTKSNNSSNEDVEILAEYTLSDGIGWYTRHFIVIKNNTDKTVDVSTSSLAYDEEGNLLGADEGSFDALGSGCTSVLYEAFKVEGEIDHYETELNFSKSKYYKSVIQDLSYEQNDIEKGAVFKVTNNGKESAEFVKGYALFIKDGKIVSYDDIYFTDDDNELKSGKTISKQMTSYEDFDKIEFYLAGRR